MPEEGLALSAEYAERIGRVVRWVERMMRVNGAADRGAVPAFAENGWCRTTGATADGLGNYPAVITVPSSDATSWTDYSAVKLKPLNGEALANATRYPARPAGMVGADECWVVADVPSTGGGGTITVKETDNSNSVSSVAILRTDVTYTTVSSPAGGTADVAFVVAASGVGGVVNTAAQVLGSGNKGATYHVGASNDTTVTLVVTPFSFGGTTVIGTVLQTVISSATTQAGLVMKASASNVYLYSNDSSGNLMGLEIEGGATGRVLVSGGSGKLGAPAFGIYNPAGPSFTDGLTASRTVKDGAGVNKTVTISGGLITAWAT